MTQLCVTQEISGLDKAPCDPLRWPDSLSSNIQDVPNFRGNTRILTFLYPKRHYQNVLFSILRLRKQTTVTARPLVEVVVWRLDLLFA